jgi:hypothetical protein
MKTLLLLVPLLCSCGPLPPPVEVDAGPPPAPDAGMCDCPDGGEIIISPLCGKVCGLE